MQGLGKFLYLFYVVPNMTPLQVIVSSQAFTLGPILCILFAGPKTMSLYTNTKSLTPKEVRTNIFHYSLQILLLVLQVLGLSFFLSDTQTWLFILCIFFMSVGWWKNFTAFTQLPIDFQHAYRLYYYSAGAVNQFAQSIVLLISCYCAAGYFDLINFWGTFSQLWANQSPVSPLMYAIILSSKDQIPFWIEIDHVF